MEPPNESSPLLKRSFFLLTTILPLAAMLLLFAKDYAVVWNEMSTRNLRCLWTALAVSGLLLLASGAYTAYLFRKKQTVSAVSAVVFLIALTAGLIVCLNLCSGMRPDVEPFILPFGRNILYFLTFYVPGITYMTMILSERLRGLRAFCWFCGLFIGIPAGLYVLLVAAAALPRCRMALWPSLIFAFLVVCGVVFYAVCISLTMRFCKIAFYWKYMRWGGLILLALVLPLGGLLLNRSIPFPADFQCREVYALTLFNAGALCFAVYRKPWLDLALVFLRGAVYWFPLYFFLVFLPFLPFFPLGIIAAGGGFLILTPTLLFLFQNYCYNADYKELLARIPRNRILTVFVLGLLTTPVLFVSNALRDKANIEHVVEYYYNSPYTIPMAEQKKQLDLPRIRNILIRLARAKDGVELPFLSEIYNRIVFRDLTLSDAKIDRIYYDLCGEQIRPAAFFPLARGDRSRSRPRPLTGLKERESVNADLKSVSVSPLPEGARVTLNIEGKSWNGEFAGNLHVPNGVFISGMTLKIGNRIVPGRIFERKSAFWIYEKITSVQRDPALLSYSTPNSLRLLVFPVNSNAPRIVTIDFLYPPGSRPEIALNGRNILLPEFAGKSGWRLRSAKELQSLPDVKRTPELVFAADRTLSAEQVSVEMKKAFRIHPEAKSFRIVSGIVGAGKLSRSYTLPELEKASAEYRAEYAPGSNGFAAQNVVKGAVLRYFRACAETDRYPVFVLIAKNPPDRAWNLSGFAELVPEYPYLTVLRKNEKPTVYSLETMAKTDTPEVRKVRRLPSGIVAVKNGTAEHLSGAKTDSAYDRAMELRVRSLRLTCDPSKERSMLPELVTASKSSGVLIPQTAYIVLETEAQWKTLEQKEKDKLKKSSAFDIEEVKADEPTLWFLLPLIFLLFLFRKRISVVRS